MNLNDSLKKSLSILLDLAYPERWDTAWLVLPIQGELTHSVHCFHIICSDLEHIKATKQSWPPASTEPAYWFRWEPTPGNGFFIRPRRYDPLLRDRFNLILPDELLQSDGKNNPRSITRQALIDACYFSAKSARMVWHNPAKGGANSPDSAHFQSMPVYWNDGSRDRFTFPCCSLQEKDSRWRASQDLHARILTRGVSRVEYPILGLVAWGPLIEAADFVWEVISRYDNARACNLVIQPCDHLSTDEAIVRIFVFPRNRAEPQFRVIESLLGHDELVLLKNNRGGVWSEWNFAGVEMGLLSQVEWGPLFEEMRMHPIKWGRTFLRLLQALTLKETEDDWRDFVKIVDRNRA